MNAGDCPSISREPLTNCIIDLENDSQDLIRPPSQTATSLNGVMSTCVSKVVSTTGVASGVSTTGAGTVPIIVAMQRTMMWIMKVLP